jgi:hypothetical protein
VTAARNGHEFRDAARLLQRLDLAHFLFVRNDRIRIAVVAITGGSPARTYVIGETRFAMS